HVDDLLHTDPADRGRREEDPRAREAGGELRVEPQFGFGMTGPTAAFRGHSQGTPLAVLTQIEAACSVTPPSPTQGVGIDPCAVCRPRRGHDPVQAVRVSELVPPAGGRGTAAALLAGPHPRRSPSAGPRSFRTTCDVRSQ